LAVWDGFAGAPGGTGSFVRYWRSHRVPVKVVPIGTKAPSMLTEAFETEANNDDDEFEAWVRASGRQEIKAIMFADVVGYSKLPETVIPKYVARLIKGFRDLLRIGRPPPSMSITGVTGLSSSFIGLRAQAGSASAY